MFVGDTVFPRGLYCRFYFFFLFESVFQDFRVSCHPPPTHTHNPKCESGPTGLKQVKGYTLMFEMVGNLDFLRCDQGVCNGVFNFNSSRRGSRKKNLINFRIYDSKLIVDSCWT